MRWRPLLASIAACVIASPALPAYGGNGLRAWSRFDDQAGVSAAHEIVASEVPGDAAISSLVSDGQGMLVVDGMLGLDNGSRWSTLGVEIAPAAGVDTDMSDASVLRIRLAAARARPLRVRIKGGDLEIGNAGCYPIVVQMVATSPADYAIPLSAFHPPSWCGTKAPSIEQTLRSVARVEVTANDAPTGAVTFSVGKVDFLAEGWSEDPVGTAAPIPAATAAASASPLTGRAWLPASAPVRRRGPGAAGAANAASSAAPTRRVVCEHSARYELMLCY